MNNQNIISDDNNDNKVLVNEKSILLEHVNSNVDADINHVSDGTLFFDSVYIVDNDSSDNNVISDDESSDNLDNEIYYNEEKKNNNNFSNEYKYNDCISNKDKYDYDNDSL